MSSVKRTTSTVSAVLNWPDDDGSWEALPRRIRNEIRDHLDAACDLMARYREARQR